MIFTIFSKDFLNVLYKNHCVFWALLLVLEVFNVSGILSRIFCQNFLTFENIDIPQPYLTFCPQIWGSGVFSHLAERDLTQHVQWPQIVIESEKVRETSKLYQKLYQGPQITLKINFWALKRYIKVHMIPIQSTFSKYAKIALFSHHLWLYRTFYGRRIFYRPPKFLCDQIQSSSMTT